MTDAWDRLAAKFDPFTARGRAGLASLAQAFLVERSDVALGLAPTRLLSDEAATAWILFWTAARRVDDSLERGRSKPRDWLEALDRTRASGLAERCLSAFRTSPRLLDTARTTRLLREGIQGLARETSFDGPRPRRAYLRLLEGKSVTAMKILDDLLFPGETVAARDAHARPFARSTQVADDCRDVWRDLRRGRCFVTQEELDAAGVASAARLARRSAFSQGRARMALRYLAHADGAAQSFRLASSRAAHQSLSLMWRGAIEAGQVRPTSQNLRFEVPPRVGGP